MASSVCVEVDDKSFVELSYQVVTKVQTCRGAVVVLETLDAISYATHLLSVLHEIGENVCSCRRSSLKC